MVAAAFLVSAAFNWPTWLVDRAGVAALGFACLALAMPAKPRNPMRRPIPPSPPATVRLEDDGPPISNAQLERLFTASRLGDTDA